MWGVSLAWSGSWEITAEAEPSGLTRVRAGMLGPVVVGPGETFTTPEVALAYSTDSLARVWHAYDRLRSRPARKPVLYNSWEATGFDVDLPSIVEPDLSGSRTDDLDVPDFLK